MAEQVKSVHGLIVRLSRVAADTIEDAERRQGEMGKHVASLAAIIVLAGLIGAGCVPAAPTVVPTAASTAVPSSQAGALAPTSAPIQATQVPAAKPTVEVASTAKYPKPGTPITIVVPWTAGGNDTTARAQAPILEKELGVPVQVVNKPGAAGQIGFTELVRADPDGYTLGLLTLPGMSLTYLDAERKAVYSRKSFQPLALQTWDPTAIGVLSNSPYKDLNDLVQAAKAKPGEIKVGTSGLMSTDHIALMMIEKATGAKFNIVHFESAPNVTALLGGHTDACTITAANLLPHVKSGVVRIVAHGSEKSSPFLPDSKTFLEQGLDIQYGASRGLTVRSETPKEVVAILENAARKAAQSDAVKDTMTKMGLEVKFLGAAEAAAYWDNIDVKTKALMDEVVKN